MTELDITAETVTKAVETVPLLAGLPPWAEALMFIALMLCLAMATKYIVRFILLRIGLRLLPNKGERVASVAGRLANIVPALIIFYSIAIIPHLPEAVVTVTRNVITAFVILTVVLVLNSVLDLLNALYNRRPSAASRPIKGYIQLVKLLLYAVAIILIIATLIEKSPLLLLLSGLGAMAAVLMLVFKDTILSFVASVRLSSNDMLRVGDWIEMPQLNADGDVIDIALHTVKVQNWDKTITTIPTHRMISESYKNWRGMQESGGRRIKRALLLDQQSIRYVTSEELNAIRRFALIDDYLTKKREELEATNAQLVAQGRDPINGRRLTNIGTFRAYVMAYLKAHPQVHQGMTQLVRQLQPTGQGLPLEVYCFTNTVAWAAYESIQSDIFDHLIAILPEFGLRVFQDPSGADMREWIKKPDEEGMPCD